jgi:hypothetical protein
MPAGTISKDIPDRLQLYNQCRYTRAHQIQEYTRLAGRDADEFKAEGKQLDSKNLHVFNIETVSSKLVTDSSERVYSVQLWAR